MLAPEAPLFSFFFHSLFDLSQSRLPLCFLTVVCWRFRRSLSCAQKFLFRRCSSRSWSPEAVRSVGSSGKIVFRVFLLAPLAIRRVGGARSRLDVLGSKSCMQSCVCLFPVCSSSDGVSGFSVYALEAHGARLGPFLVADGGICWSVLKSPADVAEASRDRTRDPLILIIPGKVG
ncbi:hypothetical protein DY000_02059470 [Brassica cretica]|uniref:Secreted protein n=1 Tax=Brassica cretica TaxID=69181 RepID=A0ABQ7B4U7_BRACR|nr:hypothetical protein DY000_02059470 [Brassica cretica]